MKSDPLANTSDHSIRRLLVEGSGREDIIVRALQDCQAEIDAGNTIDRAAMIAKYPEIREELSACLDGLEIMRTTASDDDTKSQIAPLRTLGDFRIVGEIGRGGMGVVYEAEQLTIRRKVALKILPMAALVDTRALQRFKNEVAAIATLDHPHIISVISIGEERGIHYFAMQLIRGQSLAAVIREMQIRAEKQQGSITGESLNQIVSDMESEENGEAKASRESKQSDFFCATESSQSLSPQDEITAVETRALAKSTTNVAKITDKTYFRNAVRLILQAADALQHAHDNGIVHRDVKPGNLLLDMHGSLFVSDFGLARIESGAGVTMTGDVLGTLRYMSPEQVLANRVVIDHRTDIYSLGVTLYEFLTLQPMWSVRHSARSASIGSRAAARTAG